MNILTLYKFIFGEAAFLRKCIRHGYYHNILTHHRIEIGGSTHEHGLYFALNGWRILHNRINTGRGARSGIINAEISPFKRMEQSIAVTALAEYAVYQLLPMKANTGWLAPLINGGLTRPFDTALLNVVGQEMQGEIAWWNLLDPAIKEAIKVDASKSRGPD